MLFLRTIFLCFFALILSLKDSSAQNEIAHQYSLYLPKSYEAGKQYPLLIFLDPSARGDFPVNKYKQVADDMELIIAGSFNSKNFDHESSVSSIKSILNDISEKYTLDEKRIWLSGFSGGARVASSYAVTDNRIKGVIACGAGFAGEEFISISHSVLFAGIVGYGDMNFEELTGIGQQLTNSKKENLLLFFEGGHQWPPAREMGIAVHWLLKDSSKKFADSLVEDLIQMPDTVSNEGMHYLSWLQVNEYEKLPVLAERMSIVKSKIESQKKFKKDKNDFQAIMNEERQFMDEFSFLFSQIVFTDIKDAVNKNTWKEKINKFKLMEKTKSRYQQLSAERLIDFSWRLCMEQYNYLMSINQFIPAHKAATILSLLGIKQINTTQMLSKAKEGMGE